MICEQFLFRSRISFDIDTTNMRQLFNHYHLGDSTNFRIRHATPHTVVPVEAHRQRNDGCDVVLPRNVRTIHAMKTAGACSGEKVAVRFNHVPSTYRKLLSVLYIGWFMVKLSFLCLLTRNP